MQTKTLYERKIENISGTSQCSSVLEYYIVERSIGEGYCELKSYGIKIIKQSIYEGGGKSEESKMINDIFFDYNDAQRFALMLAENMVTPSGLKNVIDDYVEKTIKMRKNVISA